MRCMSRRRGSRALSYVPALLSLASFPPLPLPFSSPSTRLTFLPQLWNPGPKTASTIGDMEPSGHERYICLEPGLIKPFQLLEPGKEWEGSITIECEA